MEPIKIPIENGIFGLYLIMRIAIFNGIKKRAKIMSFFIKRTIYSTAVALFFILLPLTTFCQTSRNHTVNVIVNPVTVMQISVGTVNLNITGANANAGQDQMSVIDQSSTLFWGTNSSARKITIRTDLAPQKYSVLAYAFSPTVGTAGLEAALSTTDNNFVTGIGRSSGRYYCTLYRYCSGISRDRYGFTHDHIHYNFGVRS